MNYILNISGLDVLIDKEDSELLAMYGPWCLSCSKEDQKAGRFYFGHNLPEVDGKRKCVKLHRIIAGALPGQIVDHINGNTLDCRKENLRIVDATVNAINTPGKDRGIVYEAKKKLWRARIQVNGKSVSLGRFKNKEDALAAYREAEMKYGYADIRARRITA